jgi:hypothetical protein
MRASRGSLVLAIATLWTAFASAGQVPETFTATASVKKGAASASAPFTVTVTRYASDAEREVVLKAVRDGGAAGLRKALSTLDDAGFVQLGERRTPIKLTIVASAPILFLGAGIPDAKPATGLEVGVAMLDLQQGGEGLGELAPAAKVGTDKNGALLIEDYGPTVMWLKGLVGAK